jgi:tetratricopeptide (TPR) repeat protein
MKHIIYILLIQISFNGMAQTFSADQQHQLDSLNAIISNPKSHDTIVVMNYFEIVNYYYLQNPDTAIVLCKKAMVISERLNFTKGKAESYGWLGYLIKGKGDISKALEYNHKSLTILEKIGDKEGITSLLNNIGSIYNQKGDNTKALKYFQKSLKIEAEIGNKAGIAYSLNNIGFIYMDQGRLTKALDFYHKSLKIREEIGDEGAIAISLKNIGVIYKNQGDKTKALEHFQKALKIEEKMGDKIGIAASLNNIGSIYKDQGEQLKALEYYQRSFTIQEEIGNKIGIATSLNNIGVIYDSQGDLLKALEFYHKSLKVHEEIGDKAGIAHSLDNIGSLEVALGMLASGENNLQRSLKLARELGSPSIISHSALNLSSIAKKQGKHKLAMQMYELHIQMRDSLNNEATQKATAQQQAKYQYEKEKAIDDVEYNKQLAIEQEAKAKQKVITVAIGVGLGLVVVFLIFVYNRLQVTKKQKNLIDKQKQEVEEAHKEITDSITYAERIQRSFLATDEILNDNLGEHFVFFQPKEAVSGDFYWAGQLSNGHFAIVNADSTGHGVPGAIMSILNVSSIEKAVEKGLTTPSDIFNDTRKTIIERLKKDGSEHGGKDGMDASLISFNSDKTKMTYVAAQNPIWIIRNGELTEVKPEKMPVGKHDYDHIPFIGGEYDIKKGDQIYTLTDGFQDQFGGPKGKKFMVKKMREYVLSISTLPMEEQLQKISDTFSAWKGDVEQIDDVCVIGVRI